MGNCTDACANKGEQEEVLAGSKTKEAGYMVGAANQGDLDVASADQNLLDAEDPAKPTLEKPSSFADQKLGSSQEPDLFYPMHSRPNEPQPPLRESSFHSRFEPAQPPEAAPQPKLVESSGVLRLDAMPADALHRSAADRQPPKPETRQSGLQQSQRMMESGRQQPQRDERPAEPAQTTPQTTDFQFRDGFYLGEAENGLPHGQGTFTNGSYTYVGGWVGGQMHGKCTIEE
jgi:hypothetical protein